MARGAKDFHYTLERQDSLFRSVPVVRPVPYMLFGREEMDAASGEGPVFRPLFKRNVDIAAYPTMGSALYISIPDHHTHFFPTVQTRTIDLNRLARKRPADRQGFESSLCEPFLFAVNCNPVLVGQVVKWRERYQQVGSRV